MLTTLRDDDLKGMFLLSQDEEGEFSRLNPGIVDSGLDSHLFVLTAALKILQMRTELLCWSWRRCQERAVEMFGGVVGIGFGL